MSWAATIARTVAPGEPLAASVAELLEQQRSTWSLLRAGSEALAGLRTRVLDVGAGRVVVQANPARRTSVHARVDAASVAARPCFLCPENMPVEERGIGVGDLVVLPNPFPIVPEHLTIPSREHRPQRLAGREWHLLEIARALGPQMLVFYNGPRCGASAPDHFHFQAGASAGVPLLDETRGAGAEIEPLSRSDRRGILLRGDPHVVSRRIARVLEALAEGPEEPLVNVVATHRDGVSNAFVFPRSAHRPDCYYAVGAARISVSPAALEMMGFLVLADVEHVDRIDTALAHAIYADVSVDDACIAALVREIE